jgi:membrane fusion protein, multidrug efflux system
MNRQLIVAVVAIALFVFVVIFGRSATQAAAAAVPPTKEKSIVLKSVQTFIASNQPIQTQIPIFGRLVANEKIELFSEISGQLSGQSPTWKAGMRFGKGDLLLQIDQSEQMLALQAQRAALLTSVTQIMPDIKIDFADNLAAWENYRQGFSVEKTIATLPEAKSSREKDFIALKTIYNQFYNIKSAEERLKKYQIYAPFSGEISETLISTGSFIRANQKLATLMSVGGYELEASVPLEDLKYLKIGDKVQLNSDDMVGNWLGKIARIASTIDNKTQTVKLFIQTNGSNLRENMFLNGSVAATTLAQVLEIPRKLLVEGDKIYTIKDNTLFLQQIQIIKTNPETVIIRGVVEGSELLKELFSTAHEGMKVQVAN